MPPFWCAAKGSRTMQGLTVRWLLAAMLGTGAVAVFAQPATRVVGRVVASTGTVSLERSGLPPSLAAAGVDLAEGDIIETIGEGTARLRFLDNSELRLRPGTRMAVTEFRLDPVHRRDESFATRLYKGGLRAITGLIAQRTPRNVTFSTPTATVGIRGTDFTMRLCEADCVRQPGRIAALPEMIAGRLGAAGGGMSAMQPDGSLRALELGDPVYVNDALVTTSGVGIIFFPDGTRIGLEANSILIVAAYRWEEVARRGAASFNLIEGAADVTSGEIAKRDSESFRFTTPETRLRFLGTRVRINVEKPQATTAPSSAPPPAPPKPSLPNPSPPSPQGVIDSATNAAGNAAAGGQDLIDAGKDAANTASGAAQDATNAASDAAGQASGSAADTAAKASGKMVEKIGGDVAASVAGGASAAGEIAGGGLGRFFGGAAGSAAGAVAGGAQGAVAGAQSGGPAGAVTGAIDGARAGASQGRQAGRAIGGDLGAQAGGAAGSATDAAADAAANRADKAANNIGGDIAAGSAGGASAAGERVASRAGATLGSTAGRRAGAVAGGAQGAVAGAQTGGPAGAVTGAIEGARAGASQGGQAGRAIGGDLGAQAGGAAGSATDAAADAAAKRGAIVANNIGGDIAAGSAGGASAAGERIGGRAGTTFGGTAGRAAGSVAGAAQGAAEGAQSGGPAGAVTGAIDGARAGASQGRQAGRAIGGDLGAQAGGAAGSATDAAADAAANRARTTTSAASDAAARVGAAVAEGDNIGGRIVAGADLLADAARQLAGQAGSTAQAGANQARAATESAAQEATQVALAALDVTMAPLLQQMTAALASLRAIPPTTEQAANSLSAQMTDLAARFQIALAQGISAAGALANSDAFKTSVGAFEAIVLTYNASMATFMTSTPGGGGTAIAHMQTMRQQIDQMRADPYRSSAASLVGLSDTDLAAARDMSSAEAQAFIPLESAAYFANKGTTATSAFLAEVRAALQLEVARRMAQVEEARQRAGRLRIENPDAQIATYDITGALFAVIGVPETTVPPGTLTTVAINQPVVTERDGVVTTVWTEGVISGPATNVGGMVVGGTVIRTQVAGPNGIDTVVNFAGVMSVSPAATNLVPHVGGFLIGINNGPPVITRHDPPSATQTAAKPGSGSASGGKTFVSVLDGSVAIESAANITRVTPGNLGIALNDRALLVPGVTTPDVGLKSDAFVAAPQFFGDEVAANTGKPGLYVSVRTGRVALEQGGRQVVLSAGETGYADDQGGAPARVRGTPGFVRADASLLPANSAESLACTAESTAVPAPLRKAGLTSTTLRSSSGATSSIQKPGAATVSGGSNGESPGGASTGTAGSASPQAEPVFSGANGRQVAASIRAQLNALPGPATQSPSGIDGKGGPSSSADSGDGLKSASASTSTSSTGSAATQPSFSGDRLASDRNSGTVASAAGSSAAAGAGIVGASPKERPTSGSDGGTSKGPPAQATSGEKTGPEPDLAGVPRQSQDNRARSIGQGGGGAAPAASSVPGNEKADARPSQSGEGKESSEGKSPAGSGTSDAPPVPSANATNSNAVMRTAPFVRATGK